MSELAVGSLAGLAANSYVIDVASGSQLTQPGMVLQVVSATKTDTFSASVASAGFTSDITGLSASITPSSTSSKILVTVNCFASRSDGFSINYGRVLRDGTPIGVGDSSGSRTPLSFGSNFSSSDRTVAIGSTTVLDSPASTSSLSYTVQLHNIDGATKTLYLNRTQGDTDDAKWGRFASTITLMEVAG